MNKKNILLGAVSLALSSCDSVKHTLGLDHYQADEYMVPTTPPLSMPPDHNLRAPEIHAQPTGYVPVRKKAQETLGMPSSSPSRDAEQNFLKKASSGEKPEGNIREIVNAEAEKEKSTLKKISDWGKEAIDNITGQPSNHPKPSTSTNKPTGIE